jgi:hypothetical protein
MLPALEGVLKLFNTMGCNLFLKINYFLQFRNVDFSDAQAREEPSASRQGEKTR